LQVRTAHGVAGAAAAQTTTSLQFW